MAKSSPSLYSNNGFLDARWQRSCLWSSRKDGDGNQVHNEVLLALPRTESETVMPKLQFVRMMLHQVIHEAGETLRSVYFCNSGMFSILNVMPDGKSVEVGLIGKEGFSGTPIVVGFRTSDTRAVVQAEATAFRMDADALRSALPKCPKLERLLNRYTQLLAVQVTRSPPATGCTKWMRDWPGGC